MPRTTETINPLDFLYPEKESTILALENFPANQILQANLSALKKVDITLAEIVEATLLPDNYKLAVTSDGNFNYKIYDQDNIGHWPAKRSAPAIAAHCNTTRQSLGLTNAAINGFGDGYNIKEILPTLLPFQALFVLEKDPIAIKTTLSIHNLSSYIEDGQLVIIFGQNPFQTLTDFLIDNNGYQLIEKSLYLYEFSEQQNKVFTSEVTTAVERAYDHIIGKLNSACKKLSEIESQKVDISNSENLTIINIPDLLNSKASIISRDILSGFKANGFNTHLNFFDSPRYASTIMQAQKYIEQKPDAVVMINNVRATSKYNFPENTPIISILTDITKDAINSLDTSATCPNDIIICEKHLQDMLPANIRNNHIEFENFVNTEIYHPLDQETLHNICSSSREITKHDVVIVTEKKPINPEAYNVKLNSQIDLINAGCSAIARDPAGYNKSLNKMYFENAKKKAKVKITDSNLNDSLLAIFAEIAKAVIIDCYGLEISKAGFDMAVYHFEQFLSNGFRPINSYNEPLPQWEHSPLQDFIKGSVCDSPKLNMINNCGKIFVCINNDGRVDPLMLNIIASGGFVLTKSHPRDNKPEGLKGLFEPGKEIITYTSTNDLCRKIEYYLNNDDKRTAIAENARLKILKNRTVKQFCLKILRKMTDN